MRIGIDGKLLASPYPSGTRNYARGLIKSLSKIDKINDYFVFVSEKVVIPKQKNFHLVMLPDSPILKRQLLLPLCVFITKIDIFHYLDPQGSLFLKHSKIITTVHDADLKPTYYKSKLYFDRIYSEIIRKIAFAHTNTFIANSHFVKQELIKSKYFIKKATSIKVIPISQNDIFIKENNTKIPKPYFMCMGDLFPRKNLITILKAYSEMPPEFKNKYDLKIVTSRKNISNKYKMIAKKYSIYKNVQTYTLVSDVELKRMYQQATCFLYPSLYEGFGIPILEAMACGCPVITSNFGAMKEIAGGAASLVNPRSIIEIKNALKRISSDKIYADLLSKKGEIRAKKFSWKKTASKTLTLYKKINDN